LLCAWNGKLITRENIHAHAETDLLRLVERIIQESGSGEGFNASAWLKRWLSDPHPALNYATPNSYMGTIEGRNLVAELLKKMQSGAFA